MLIVTNRTPNDDSNGETKASIEAILGDTICAITDKKGEGKNIFEIIVRQWKAKQSDEEQQSKREIQKHIEEFKVVNNEIQQQHKAVLKSLEATKDQRIESANAIKQ